MIETFVRTANPIIFYVDNTDTLNSQSATLFMSSQNRNEANYGQSPFINIFFAFPNTTYTQLLADSENEVFRIWKMRFDILNANPPSLSTVQEDYYVSKREADGSITSDPLHPYQDLDQTVPTAVEFRYPINIDADKGITFTLSPATSIPPPLPNYNFNGGGGGGGGGGGLPFMAPVFRLRVMIWVDKTVSLSNVIENGYKIKNMTKPMPLELKAPYVVEIDPMYNVGKVIVGKIIYDVDKSMNFKPTKNR